MNEEHNNAPAVPLGYINAGHLHEMQSGRVPYAYLYAAPGVGVEVPVYATPAPTQCAPLSDDDITLLLADKIGFGDTELQTVNRSDLVSIIRAVEAAAPAPEPAQEVRLTDEEIESLPVWGRFCGLWSESRKDIAYAIITALREKEKK